MSDAQEALDRGISELTAIGILDDPSISDVRELESDHLDSDGMVVEENAVGMPAIYGG